MAQKRTMIDMTGGRERERRLGRIRRLSRAMAMGCLVTSWLLAVGMFFYWAVTPARTLFSQAGIAGVAGMEIGFSTRLLACGISMVPLGVLIYGFLSARRCFDAFAAGEIFSSEPARRLKTFSVAAAASALLQPLAGAALSVFLSFSNPGGSKTLALHIGSDTLIVLVFAGTVAVMAWVMGEASDIADENQQFV